MFVCLGFIVPVENLSTIWRRHHYRWRAANFDLCSALMAIEQWGFFSVPHLLWHGVSVYNGHLQGPVTLTPIVERLVVEMSLYLFLLLRSIAVGIRRPNLTLCRTNALTQCTTAAAKTLFSTTGLSTWTFAHHGVACLDTIFHHVEVCIDVVFYQEVVYLEVIVN